MIRVKTNNLDGKIVAQALVKDAERTDSATARQAYREVYVQILEQIVDKRVGTAYVHIDTPKSPWMLTDLTVGEHGIPEGKFERRGEEPYWTGDLADWRRF